MNSIYTITHSIYDTVLDFFGPANYLVDERLLPIGVLCIALLWLLPKKKTTDHKHTPPNDVPHSVVSITTHTASQEPSDYDFLATDASSPAQFDLVIAYTAMGQKSSALALLEKLQRSEDVMVRDRAEKMLKTLTSP